MDAINDAYGFAMMKYIYPKNFNISYWEGVLRGLNVMIAITLNDHTMLSDLEMALMFESFNIH
jgi:hypothetical protein